MENTPLELAKKWAQNPYFDEPSRNEIQKLIDGSQNQEISDRFYKDLEFGTGGMRSILGQGTNRMNKYNIRKATQAIANVVNHTSSDSSDNIGKKQAVVCYDSRLFSFEFAKEAASVFAANGIEALIYQTLNPVALASFAIRFYNAQAGVMVTASHNPPEYNGYKVFWSDGAQVIPPIDKKIIDEFTLIADYASIQYMPFDEGLRTGLIRWIGSEVEEAYFNAIKEYAINPQLCHDQGRRLKVVYTPLHGTGLRSCLRALSDIEINNVYVVEEQAHPDGNFPTVKSPNPENPEALALAVKLMDKENADLAMGSDPDTDRLGVALTHNGETVYLTGNQIGILMLHYILVNLKERRQLPDNSYFIKTIVTTPLQEVIAENFGVACENTLTGFKWICGRLAEIENDTPHRHFLFGTEESFGYLNHPHIRDKDGVSSVSLMAEIALAYKIRGKNLIQALDDIYEEYGFSHETLLCLDYFGQEGSDKIKRIMEYFRREIKHSFMDEEIVVCEDYQKQMVWRDVGTKSENEQALNFPKSNVLGYHLKSGNRVYLRPSGTEPKIKFYIMIQETEGELAQKKMRAQARSSQIVEFIKNQVKEL